MRPLPGWLPSGLVSRPGRFVNGPGVGALRRAPVVLAGLTGRQPPSLSSDCPVSFAPTYRRRPVPLVAGAFHGSSGQACLG